MEDDMWVAEFAAKPLGNSGRFAPVVILSRRAGDGARESSITYEGAYATQAEAADAARRHYLGHEH